MLGRHLNQCTICSHMSYPEMMQAVKSVAQFTGWSVPEAETNYIWFDAPLEVAGVIEAGFVLHGGCYRHAVDRHVTFEIRATAPKTRKKVPLARVDWRSLTGGHTNRRCRANPWGGKRVSNSHYHSFAVNWVEVEQRLRSDLSQAIELDENIQSFESLRNFVASEFNINNMHVVTVPPWEYDLTRYG